MAAAAVVLGLGGIVLLFAPAEVAASMGTEGSALALQVVGCGWFAFAILDWTGRGGLLGGIFGRPVVLGNLTLFLTTALVLLRAGGAAAFAGIVCAFFALAFGVLLFRHPDPPR